MTPSPEDGPGPTNAGRYVVNRPRLSRQANVFEEHYEPEPPRSFLRADFPFVDECDNGYVLYDRNRLYSRPKSFSECVQSSSFSDVAETSFTVPVEINKVDDDRPPCSIAPSSSSQDEALATPVLAETPQDSPPVVVEPTHSIVDRQNSEAFCTSDRSECTPTEDLYFYTDCQALYNTSSATEDEIFYSQLEELTLSTVSVSEDLPVDTEFDQNTFCCDMFSPGTKDDAKSVFEEELEEDSNEKDCPENLVEVGQPEVPTSHVQNHFSDCFPI